MLHVFLSAPFPSPARQALFEAVRAALSTPTPAGTATLLAGNLALPNGRYADAVVVRPHSLTILLFHPTGGMLSIPNFAAAPWLLDGQSITAVAENLNPYQLFQELRPAVLAQLSPWLPVEAINPHFVTGLWLAAAPLRFAPDVEVSMSTAPEARQLQLVADVARLPRRLAQLATPEIDLTLGEIRQLADALAQTATPVPPSSAAADSPATLSTKMQNTARQLWRWLGAEDVSDLPPDTYELTARGEDRKHELEAQQLELQRQLAEQLRAIEAREAARETSMAQLRAELQQAQQQAAPNTAELQARLAAENQAHEAEEARRRASQEEWKRRNQDLDAKLQALEQLMQRLQPAAEAAPSAAAAISRPSPAPTNPKPPTAPVTPAPLAGVGVPTTAAPQPRPSGQERLRVWLQRLPSQAWLQALWPKRGATDHWLGLVVLAVLGFAAMIWLGTQGFTRVPPEPYQANGRWGFSKHDQPVVEARYASVQPFQEDRAVVERDGAFGAIDADGQEVVPPAYDALNSYSEGYARARIGNLYTFVDKDGEEFSHYFYNAYDFAEGYAPVLDRRGWFYISGPDAGVPEHPRLFQEAYPFREGRARVRKNGSYTFIDADYLTDTTRHDTAPFGRYEQASDFADGKARVRQKGRSFYIDRDGEEVSP